jgi:putative oxidoreductase
MRFLTLAGRILFSAIFIMSAPGHFSQHTISFAAQHGLPMANILVPLSGIVAFVGGVSILLGFQAKLGGLCIALFLIPVTLTMHNFWAAPPAMRMMQQGNFMKNTAMLGCAFMIMYFGAGPLSIDAWLKSRSNKACDESGH